MIGFLIALAFIIGMAISIAITIIQHKKTRKITTTGKVCLGIAGVFLLLTILIAPSFHTVDTGEVAVVKYMGEAKDVRTAGTHFDFWITNSYSRYDAKVQNLDIATAAYSSDAQTMDVAMTLQYQIMSDKAIDIATEYGSLYVLQSRIQSIAIEKAKSVLSSYKAMDIISDRASMSPKVEEAIKAAISDKYFVTISTVVLTNIDFSDAFEKAVEDKMIAEQNQLRAEYENAAKIAAAEAEAKAAIEKAQGEAEAKLKAAQAEIEIAKAEAEAKIAQAQGEADAQLKIAQAEATALKLKSIEIARALGFKITESIIDHEDGTSTTEYEISFEGKSENEIKLITDYLKYVEYINKWDGKLPTVMTESGANVVIPTNPVE
ncbi:MAG: prohibitin family protein [Ruminococcaceae bacterium]|nr:prohibitin family protein [Oscillospiraceae bacterium]